MPVDIEIGFFAEDPKSTFAFQIKENLEIWKDNGEDAATAYVAYNKPPETVKQLLAKYDTIITVGDPESDNVTPIGINTTRCLHQAIYSLRVYAIDKDGITAKKMIWQLVNEIWRIITQTASNPGGTVKFWRIVTGQIAEDKMAFKPLLICRRIRVYVRFMEEYA